MQNITREKGDHIGKHIHKVSKNMSLRDSYVVIETLVNENGIPKLNKAYLLAAYNVEGLIAKVDA